MNFVIAVAEHQVHWIGIQVTPGERDVNNARFVDGTAFQPNSIFILWLGTGNTGCIHLWYHNGIVTSTSRGQVIWT